MTTLDTGNDKPKIILVANTSWFLINFELPLIRELQANNFDVIAVAPKDEWSEQFNALDVVFKEVPMNRRGLNPLSDFAMLLRLYRIYTSEKPNVVFHNTIKPVIYGSIAARYAKVQRVLNMIPGLGHVFVGDSKTNRMLRSLVKKMYKFALKISSKVFFQNPDDKQYFIRNRLIAEQRTEVTYGLGVDLEKFYFVEPFIKNGECTFILCARMLWDKGVGEFVEAAKKVRQSFPLVKFQLLGRIDKGNPSGINERTIREWNDSGIIQYSGEVADIRNILAKSDVAVLPSYYREGIPNSLMEAMAMGKPIITTNTPGCRETVVENLNGLLVPPRDVQSLIEAMMFMITNPEKRTQMGKEGRELAEKRFDVNRVNALLLKAMDIS